MTKKFMLLIALVLLCAGAMAGPRPGKRFNNKRAYCPYMDRQVFGVPVGSWSWHSLKKNKKNRLSEYQNSR